ncbi:hypothetical protein PU629_12565 [Pullulanibacillus sp. KACC 23026]|uniref:hypothetical protein n=1 Tax=Pullulanibacillus sp. KACC 23026 TaxID=3028315 RepID=UPI0023AF14A8|nr:hypothetical protein [Pullulanibacillus sp. KACC 23026]WEG11010.1 hypothetical protein PU629_12565 [Pullulanibacillus sp. KACC 23026]
MFREPWLLYFACMLAGFGLIRVSASGTFLAGLDPILNIIGVLAVIVFALLVIIHGIAVLFKKI